MLFSRDDYQRAPFEKPFIQMRCRRSDGESAAEDSDAEASAADSEYDDALEKKKLRTAAKKTTSSNSRKHRMALHLDANDSDGASAGIAM